MKRLKVVITAIVVVALLVGCGRSVDQPENLLPREKFVEVLVEVQLIEAVYNQNMLRNDDPRARIARYYDESFDRLGVTKEVFEETYLWYFAHPKEMMDVLDEVVMLLGKKQNQLLQQAEPTKVNENL